MILTILLLLPCLELFSQDSYFEWEGSISGKGGANATIRVFSDDRVFLFASDDNGKVNIRYFRPTTTDSVLITSIGYKPHKLSCGELMQVREIQLEEDIYFLSEVVVTPSRKARIINLGNRTSFFNRISSTNSFFDSQQGLLIKYEETHGRILTVRYNMKNRFGNDMHQRPFRVMIYDMDTINNMPGKDLLNEYLIVSLNAKGNWLEVDVSHYNIELPPKGVFIGMEILPAEYYFANYIINDISVRNGARTTDGRVLYAVNSVSVGVTSRSRRSYESWRRINYNWQNIDNVWQDIGPTEWKRYTYSDFLFNIVVEKRE